jgi:carbon monoxide dehydrogenase subunit G
VRTTFPVSAPPEAWAALADPARLVAALPGARSVTPAGGDGALSVVLDLAVASVGGLWSGTVTPLDADAVRIAGSGGPGSLDLEVRANGDRTALTVEGEVGGPLATVGGAVLAAAARRLAEGVLAALSSPLAVTPAAQPAPPRGARRVPGRPAVAAAGACAGAVVVGVAVVRRWRRGPR